MNKLSSVIRSILILVTTGLINPAFADQHSATGIAYSDVVSKITSSYKELCKKTILDEAYVLNIDETAVLNFKSNTPQNDINKSRLENAYFVIREVVCPSE